MPPHYCEDVRRQTTLISVIAQELDKYTQKGQENNFGRTVKNLGIGAELITQYNLDYDSDNIYLFHTVQISIYLDLVFIYR